MRHLCTQLLNDEAGFIVSAELVLVATIAVLAMVVGLTEVAAGVNQELEDVASAFGSMNQSFSAKGFSSMCKSNTAGSSFTDNVDDCDSEQDIVGSGPTAEASGS